MNVEVCAEFCSPYEGVDYTWRRRVLRWLLRKFIFTTVVKVEVEGTERVPKEGAAVLMVNHTAFLEPVAVAGVLDREDIVPMSKIENFKTPVISYFVWNWGAFSVRRGQLDRKALNYGIEVLKTGGSLLIAPEGTRRPKLKRAHNGLAYMALKTDALIVPVGVAGADQFKTNIRQMKRTGLRVQFGRPFRFNAPDLDPDAHVSRNVLTTMTNEAMYQLAALLPERLRGYYGDMGKMTTNYLAFEG